jgi:hypothetical protein
VEWEQQPILIVGEVRVDFVLDGVALARAFSIFCESMGFPLSRE